MYNLSIHLKLSCTPHLSGYSYYIACVILLNALKAQEDGECGEDERSIQAHICGMSIETLKGHPDVKSLKEGMSRTHAH